MEKHILFLMYVIWMNLKNDMMGEDKSQIFNVVTTILIWVGYLLIVFIL